MALLIDYSSLLYRAFHSLPETIPMRGVYGFLGMLARLLADRRPERLAIAVDEDWRPAFRVTALPTYKAHRVSDEPDPVALEEALGRRLLAALGFAVAGSPGFEDFQRAKSMGFRLRSSTSTRAPARRSSAFRFDRRP